jgi:hypothetical protein
MADPFAQFMVNRVRMFNPDTGASFVLTFKGTQAQMEAVASHYEILGAGAPIGYGYKTHVTRTPRGHQCVVHIPDEILYTTRWHLETEITSISMWWLPDVRAFAGNTSDLTTFIGLREWLQEVAKMQMIINKTKHALAPLDQATFDLLNSDVNKAALVYTSVRDGEFSDWKRPVLKRNRVIPVGIFDVRTRLVGPPQLYSLDGIYNLFGLDNNTYDQAVTVYDDLPATDPNTIWAWKLRRDDSESLIGSGKVIECRDWVFDRWSTIKNTFIE